MKKYCTALLAYCLASNLAWADIPYGVKQADLPIYAPNEKLSLWVGVSNGMEGVSAKTYLYSDGAYCYTMSAMGAVVFLNGKWQFNKNHTAINVNINTNSNNQFFLHASNAVSYDNDQPKAIARQSNIRLSDLFFYEQPVYLGFGVQSSPEQMVLFDYDKHKEYIVVPNSSRYLFVASKVKEGQMATVARFDLSKLSKPYAVDLVSNRSMGVQMDEILENNLNYAIQNGKVGSYRYDTIDFFDTTVSIDPDKISAEDSKMDYKRLHRYCAGNANEPYLSILDNEYADILDNEYANFTKPTYIQWRGKIAPTANWLNPRD